jgi:hypothetical protein
MEKYKLNELVFEKVSDLASYWAGFIAADGNIKQPKYGQKILTLTIAERDQNHLKKFRKFIQSNKPIYKYKNGAYSFEVSSNKICEDLLKNFSVDAKKTLTLKFPNLKLQHRLAFIIGYIDGDGCLYIDKKTNRLSLSIVGTQDVLRSIEITFNRILGITTKRTLYSKNDNEIYDIRWNNKQAREIVSYLRSTAQETPSLDRKWNKAFNNVQTYVPFHKSIERCKKVKVLKEEGKSNKEIMRLTGLKSKTSIYNCLNNK